MVRVDILTLLSSNFFVQKIFYLCYQYLFTNIFGKSKASYGVLSYTAHIRLNKNSLPTICKRGLFLPTNLLSFTFNSIKIRVSVSFVNVQASSVGDNGITRTYMKDVHYLLPYCFGYTCRKLKVRFVIVNKLS